jgi:hypothetical protein
MNVLNNIQDVRVYFGRFQASIDRVHFSNTQQTRIAVIAPASPQYGAVQITVSSGGKNASRSAAILYVPALNPTVFLISPRMLYTRVSEPMLLKGVGFPATSSGVNTGHGRLISPSGKVLPVPTVRLDTTDDGSLLINLESSVDVNSTGWGLVTLFVNGAEASQAIQFIEPSGSPKLVLDNTCCSWQAMERGVQNFRIVGSIHGYHFGRFKLAGTIASLNGSLSVSLGIILVQEKNAASADFRFTANVQATVGLRQILQDECKLTIWVEGNTISAVSTSMSYNPMQIMSIHPTSGYMDTYNSVKILARGLWMHSIPFTVRANDENLQVGVNFLNISENNAVALLHVNLSYFCKSLCSSLSAGKIFAISISNDVNSAHFNFTIKSSQSILVEIHSFSGIMSDDKQTLIGTLLGGEILNVAVKMKDKSNCSESEIRFGNISVIASSVESLITMENSTNMDTGSACILTFLIPKMQLAPQTLFPILKIAGFNTGLHVSYILTQPLSPSIRDISPTRIMPNARYEISMDLDFCPRNYETSGMVAKISKKNIVSQNSDEFRHQDEVGTVLFSRKAPLCNGNLCSYSLVIVTPNTLVEGIFSMRNRIFSIL